MDIKVGCEESGPALSSEKAMAIYSLCFDVQLFPGVPDMMMLPRDRNGVEGTHSVDSVNRKHVQRKNKWVRTQNVSLCLASAR